MLCSKRVLWGCLPCLDGRLATGILRSGAWGFALRQRFVLDSEPSFHSHPYAVGFLLLIRGPLPPLVISESDVLHRVSLYDFYTNGISEGDYSHTPNVDLSEVFTGAGTTLNRPAPTLIDLINEENISPSMADKEAYDELLFNYPDPYDLAETERVKSSNSQPPAVSRSQTRFAITEYIKLESPALAELLQPTKQSAPGTASPMDTSDGVQAGRPDDWSFDDFLV
ncbi:hypothetical protein B0H11DRAFT_1918340 [Mycena galericulata]|nr:hypothetical protein B0H11DRAFT_1918340 [Mycena galericulata]